MKKSFLIVGLSVGISVCMPTKLWSQWGNCTNLNFNMGNFTYWQGYTGTWNTGPQPSAITGNRHEIMDAAYLQTLNQFYDGACPKIPKVPTGFNYSAKLGNTSTSAELEALEYVMTVDSSNSLLVLHFAWVMENPNHPPNQQPMFTMEIRDSLGRPIPGLPCGTVNFVSGNTNIALACVGSVEARDWTTVGFSLEPLMGRTIKIYYETRDCSATAHYGYAYLVAECRPMRIDLAFCTGMNVARMTAPDGFVRYTWKRSRDPNWIITGDDRQAKRIVVERPYDNEIFTCSVESELGPQCSAQLKVEILRTSVDADFVFGVKLPNGHVPVFDPPHNGVSWYDTCNRTVSFVELVKVKNSTKKESYWEIMDPEDRSGKGVLWTSYDSIFTHTFPDPDVPTTYRVRLTAVAENECLDTSQSRPDQHITIYPSPKIEVNGKDQMCEGESNGLKAVTIRSEFISHEWTWTDTNGTHKVPGDSITVYSPGTYIVTAEDIAGCIAVDTFKVTTLKPVINELKIRHVDCYGKATGYFTHGTITGGKSPYELFWIFKDINGNDSAVLGSSSFGMYTDLKAGIYRFFAYDADSCILADEIEIEEKDSLKIFGKQYPTTCNLDNGRMKLLATGGFPPYKFKIEKEDDLGNPFTLTSSGDSAINLPSGLYRITVTDATVSICVTSDTISVLATPMPSIEITGIDMETCDKSNGNIRGNTPDARHPMEVFLTSSILGNDTLKNDFVVFNSLKGGQYHIHLVDANGCKADEDVVVPAFSPLTVDIAKTSEFCGRKDGTITLTVNNRPDINGEKTIVYYVWEGINDTTLSALTGLKAGTYSVHIKDTFCYLDTTIVIDHVPGPIANFEANSYNVAANTVFTLTDASHSPANPPVSIRNWNWDMGDENTQTGRIVYYTYGATGDYIIGLEIIDENGCLDTISKVIHVYEELNVFIPNMFTPNGDGLNDTWKPEMSEYAKEGYQLSVFDRWGQVIFYTRDTEAAWDGTVKGKKVAPNTTYAYRIIVRDFTGQEYEFVGHITVLE